MSDILIVDDDNDVLEMLNEMVTRMGHHPESSSTLKEARQRLLSHDYDVIFLDVRLTDGNGLDILPLIKEMRSTPEVVIITGHGDSDSAELAMKSGVWDFIQKPSSLSSMRLILTRALQYREKKGLATKPPVLLKLDKIVGSSSQLRGCFDLVAQAAQSDINVLITGETGTGKELFARAIHDNSQRSGKSFVVVDCAAMPENLVESMLFGHEKGAFTGADRNREGLIKHADGGTLFLDEIGELPPLIQKSFLRVLQEHRFRPIGSSREEQSDFRLIAATNRKLDKMVANGQFRTDLLFRIQSLTVDLPPLRERKEDIKELTVHYLGKFCEGYGVAMKGVAPEFFEALTTYEWPGNVRELVNVVDTVVCSALHEPTLYPKHLPIYMRVKLAHASLKDDAEPGTAGVEGVRKIEKITTLNSFREGIICEAEQQYLDELLARTHNDIQEACRISGLSRSRLYALLKKYDLIKARI
jgi:two-component system, NtrC family, response regulator